MMVYGITKKNITIMIKHNITYFQEHILNYGKSYL